MPNYTYGNKFRFTLYTERLLGEKLDLNVISTSVPGVAIGTTEQRSPYMTIPWIGDSLTIDDLTVNFILSENLLEWRYLFKWMSLLKECSGKDIDNYELDASLVLLTNKSNQVFTINFQRVFPYQLSPIEYTDQITDADVLTMSATFKIKNISITDAIDSKIGELQIVT